MFLALATECPFISSLLEDLADYEVTNTLKTNYEFLHRLPMRKLGWTERGARWPDPMEISDSSLIDGALMAHRMVLPWRRRDVGPAIQRRQARRRMPGTILLLALT